MSKEDMGREKLVRPTFSHKPNDRLDAQRSGPVREKLWHLNGIELPIKGIYCNEKLLPDALRDIVPKKGVSGTFPFLIRSSHEDPSGGLRFAVREGHSRSAYLGTCDVIDGKNHYIYMDVKGIGYSQKNQLSQEQIDGIEWRHDGRGEPRGILSRPLAENDLDFSERFAKAGIGGHRVAAMFGYQKLPLELRRGYVALMKVSALRQIMGHVPYRLRDEPVAVVRIFTEIRVNAVQRGQLMPLFNRLNDRFGCNVRTGRDYCFWFAKQTGRNLAIMHKLGCTHKYLSEHNVLADGTFIDDDSVTGPEDYGVPLEKLRDNSRLSDKDLFPRNFLLRKMVDIGAMHSCITDLLHTLVPALSAISIDNVALRASFQMSYDAEMKKSRLSAFEE